ncbi:hypothetical protein ACHAXS_004989, partial [Conticribra weissflogii]
FRDYFQIRGKSRQNLWLDNRPLQHLRSTQH